MSDEHETSIEGLGAGQSSLANYPQDTARGAAILNGMWPPAPPTQEQVLMQEQMQRRAEEESARYEAREARVRQEQRDDSLRAACLSGALMLDYPSKDAAAVLAAAREIEAFMRGNPTA